MKLLGNYATSISAKLYRRTPKAVFAALAVSPVHNGAANLVDNDTADSYVLREWAILHAQGIVPQRPPKGSPVTAKTATPAFTTDEGQHFYAFPAEGCYYAVAPGTKYPLLQVAMNFGGGGPEVIQGIEDDEYNVVEVIAPGHAFLAEINAFFGTTFTPADFAGR